MAERLIGTRIELEGEKEFKRQMSNINSELGLLRSEMMLVDAEFKGQANSVAALTKKDEILRKEIGQQQSRIEELKKIVEEASQAYKNATENTDAYKKKLNQYEAQLNKAQVAMMEMNRELQDTDKYLEEAKESADGCAKSIDGFGKSTGENLGPLEGFKSNLSALGVAGAAGLAVAGLDAVTDAAFDLVASTEEYRKVMGTLEVSSQAAGYSAEETAEVYNRLYNVLGDTQAAATTVANLQAIGLEQDQLKKLTDAAIGAWATYGDSIPIDGLAEAINETVQVGKVTGAFADVLNWAGGSEDAFNASLERCATASDRANMVLQTLTDQGLTKAADAWFEANQDIVANNEATARMEEAMARLAEKLVPLTTGLKTLGAETLVAVIEAGEDVIELFNELGGYVIDGFIDGIQERWGMVVDTVSGLIDAVKNLFTGKDGFDTHSPSKWSEEMFGNVLEGMIVGNERNAARAIQAARQTTEEMLDALSIPSGPELSASLSLPARAGAGGGQGGGTAPATSQRSEPIVINLTAEMDGAVLARKQYKYNRREGELRGDSLVEVSG